MTIARLDELVARVKQLARGIITAAELRGMCGDGFELDLVTRMADAVGEDLMSDDEG